ncbi:MAG: hypothetical protein LBT01_02650 [Spirochaetaceae bacterium]|jgi:DNA-directed RNA polymerase specialized sigma24 family protein|nr:hypothetical protein [Spirochaetaceae bacterium]
MQGKPINIFYAEYKAKVFDKRELEAKIFQYVLENPEYFGLCFYKDKDERTDFMCWLYPRMHKSIDRFKQGDATFDTYINSIVRYADKEFRGKRSFRYETESAIWDESVYDMMAAEEEAVYGLDSNAQLELRGKSEKSLCKNDKPQKTIANPKQTLILLLKSYYFVTDDLIERIAPSLGLTQKEIFEMIDELHSMRLGTEAKIQALKQRCFSQHFRCISIEKRLRNTDKDSIYYKTLNDKIKLHRTRLIRMRQRLKCMRIDASNRQVAQVLGVSKGTVDANLHAIKKRLG